MEYDKIKQLMEYMSNSKLSSMNIEFDDGTKISMRKDAISDSAPAKTIQYKEKSEETIVLESEPQNDGKYILSPMVGTFYIKPAPTADPFVKSGSAVNKGQTVCIIEAMKLMNEIESEYDGKILEVLVKDGDPVEYGTKLFKIE